MQEIHLDDQESLDRIEAEGFTPWGPPVTFGKDLVRAFLDLTSAPHNSGEPTQIPGVMLQAMLPKLTPGQGWQITGNNGAVNLGCPSIRFPQPVASSAILRGRSCLASSRPHARGVIITMGFEVREEGADTPCLQSTMEVLYLRAEA